MFCQKKAEFVIKCRLWGNKWARSVLPYLSILSSLIRIVIKTNQSNNFLQKGRICHQMSALGEQHGCFGVFGVKERDRKLSLSLDNCLSLIPKKRRCHLVIGSERMRFNWFLFQSKRQNARSHASNWAQKSQEIKHNGDFFYGR